MIFVELGAALALLLGWALARWFARRAAERRRERETWFARWQAEDERRRARR